MYEVYGLQIIVNGFNSTTCNGIIQVDLIESCNIYNRTGLARLNIKLEYFNEVEEEIIR